LFDFFHEGQVRMNRTNALADRIMLGLGVMTLLISTGCIVPVGGGGDYYGGGPTVVSGPDMVLYGGNYDRGRDFDSGHDAHAYSERGVASRAVAHPGGVAHVAAPHGGGGGEQAKKR
jgi:hypothetical protein